MTEKENAQINPNSKIDSDGNIGHKSDELVILLQRIYFHLFDFAMFV